MTPPKKRYRCRLCGAELPAWLPVLRGVDAAMLLAHLGRHHAGQIEPYLDRMETEEDIDTILTTEVFEAVEAPEAQD